MTTFPARLGEIIQGYGCNYFHSDQAIVFTLFNSILQHIDPCISCLCTYTM